MQQSAFVSFEFAFIAVTDAAPLTRAKPLFLGQKPATENKKDIVWYLLNKKTEFIPSSEMKCPKSGIYSYGVGWVEQSNSAG